MVHVVISRRAHPVATSFFFVYHPLLNELQRTTFLNFIFFVALPKGVEGMAGTFGLDRYVQAFILHSIEDATMAREEKSSAFLLTFIYFYFIFKKLK